MRSRTNPKAKRATKKHSEGKSSPKAKSAKGKQKTSNTGETKAIIKEQTGSGGVPIESLWDERALLDGGVPLPEDGVGFVDAVNVNIDLIRLTEILLRGTDERSTKSLLERLLEMRYGKKARAAAEEAYSVIDCVSRSKPD